MNGASKWCGHIARATASCKSLSSVGFRIRQFELQLIGMKKAALLRSNQPCEASEPVKDGR